LWLCFAASVEQKRSVRFGGLTQAVELGDVSSAGSELNREE
jgi:hypothetical protein